LRIELAICRAGALGLGLAVAAVVPAAAQDFYRGKTVTIVAGFTPGGGFDVNAWLLTHQGDEARLTAILA
jgi:tripartite-type tricarboxylate transporter receptor subunit TctC